MPHAFFATDMELEPGTALIDADIWRVVDRRQRVVTVRLAGVMIQDMIDRATARLVDGQPTRPRVKSVADKMRRRTGLTDDRATIVDRGLGGNPPLLAINPYASASELSQQKGFANLVRGTFGIFRNPPAHETRIRWAMTKEDAEALLTIVSLIHRRLDKVLMPPWV